MAADPQTEKQVTRNLKTEPPARNINPAFSKEGSPSDATSCISYTGEAAGGIKEAEVDHDSLTTPYQDNSYHGYYYPGNDVSFAEVDEQGHYSSSNGLGIQYPAMQADNGSLIYYTPGFQPCYDYYSSYFPVAPLGIDGQYVGQQPYSPGSMFSSPIASPGYISTPPPYGSDLVQSSYVWDPSFLVGNGGYVNSYSGYPDNAIPVSTSSAASHVPAPAPRFMLTSDFSKPSALVVSTGHGAREAVDKPSEQCPTLFPSHQQSKSGLLYSNSSQNLKASAKSWEGSGKLHTRNRSNGVGDFSLLNMHNHGPRTVNAKDALGNEAGSFSIEGNGSDNNIVSKTRRDQYNRPDFPTNYNHGLFFVIKSYSEDDIHKSIKYNVWASTSNGNKRLDSAYQEAQERMKEQGSKCPLFLFFSVNASGQFCGVAEMVGRVDFNKNMDFWQQDKWTGYFPVKWHIIKDVPNPQLRHIILENNDNKPVTNSRDTQEVRFSQGIEMLNIFVNFVFKTCILDDFEFYERRQKVMQEKRMKPCPPRSDSFQPKSEDMAIRFHSLDISGEPEKGDEGKE